MIKIKEVIKRMKIDGKLGKTEIDSIFDRCSVVEGRSMKISMHEDINIEVRGKER